MTVNSVIGGFQNSLAAFFSNLLRVTGFFGHSYRWVGVCFAGFGGAGGSVGDVWISCGSTRLQALVAVPALVRRNSVHAASVSLQSVEPFPISKHHS
jgi:hypothetical protein